MQKEQTGQPWDEWIPGVLSKNQIIQLQEKGLITGLGPRNSIDYSSFDVSVSREAYRMRKGSVKPSGDSPYSWFIEQAGLAEKQLPDSDGTFTLNRKQTYVFKLRQKLERGLCALGINGQATAKSSVGRMDVLARQIGRAHV